MKLKNILEHLADEHKYSKQFQVGLIKIGSEIYKPKNSQFQVKRTHTIITNYNIKQQVCSRSSYWVWFVINLQTLCAQMETLYTTFKVQQSQNNYLIYLLEQH